MIQRLQSIYLLASAILTLVMLSTTLVTFVADDIIYEMTAFSISSTGSNVEVIGNVSSLAIILSIISLISIVTIFLYKKRKLQMRLSVYNMILMLGLYALGFYYANQISSKLIAVVNYSYAVLFPVVSLILTFLAYRFIMKDEILIKSMDRIR